VLDLIAHQTNGVHFNQLDHHRLKQIRYEDHDQSATEEVTAAWTRPGNLKRGEFTASKRRRHAMNMTPRLSGVRKSQCLSGLARFTVRQASADCRSR